MRNLHQFYYKKYFPENLNWEDINSAGNKTAVAESNQTLCQAIHSYTNPIPPNPLVNEVIPLEVLYPGLVTGIGIDHEVKIEGEFKLGMHFDWTYGMPVIYGSSVKGVLRSYFKEFYKPQANEPGADETFDDIFNGGSKSIYDRDIFFDAVISKGDKKDRILCSDSITPHGGEKHDNPLQNPTPITFLKIASGCQLEFRFKLVPTTAVMTDGTKRTLSIQRKKEIFQEILTTVGIGAKTNVGYGQLK